MLALSIRQPWAWLILNSGKDIENRSWPTRVRGRVLIHASKGMTQYEYEDAYEFALRANFDGPQMPHPKALTRGGIVGSIEIADCVSSSASPWFVGDYGFVLRDPCPHAFLPCKGQLGFFAVADA